jgi:hypothetical protein
MAASMSSREKSFFICALYGGERKG